MEITPINKLLERLDELKGQSRFPTQFDALEAWLYGINTVVENIAKTSLNHEDRRKREQELMDKILKDGK